MGIGSLFVICAFIIFVLYLGASSAEKEIKKRLHNDSEVDDIDEDLINLAEDLQTEMNKSDSAFDKEIVYQAAANDCAFAANEPEFKVATQESGNGNNFPMLKRRPADSQSSNTAKPSKTPSELGQFRLAKLKKTIVNFGKYQGLTWGQVPQDYLDWMLRVNHKYYQVAVALLNYQ